MNLLIIASLLSVAAVVGGYFAAKRIKGDRERRFITGAGSAALCGVIIVAALSCFVPGVSWASVLGFGLVFGFALVRRRRQIQREDASIA